MDSKDIAKAKELILNAKNIVIIAHKSPDGDSIGSSLGLYNALVEFRNDVEVCMPDPFPEFLAWMKNSSQVINFEENLDEVTNRMDEADLIFCLDFNTESRVGKMEDLLKKAKGTKVMIDHHQNPSDFADLTFSFPNECSTSQLIYKFLKECDLNKYLTIEAAECLYCGIMTDTGSFKFPSTTAETHRIIADFIDLGVDHFKIHESVFDQNTEGKLKLRSFVLSDSLVVLKEYRTAILSVTMETLEKYNYVKGDTEGLVNVALSLGTVDRAVFFTEDEEIVKISFRSKGVENPVNAIASTHFHGGGHINAAGGKFDGGLKDAIDKFVTVLPEFV